jgi:hypothetical protein
VKKFYSADIHVVDLVEKKSVCLVWIQNALKKWMKAKRLIKILMIIVQFVSALV